jgi:UDP-glucose 4-epimerase
MSFPDGFTIGLTGATGMIGAYLRERLRAGYPGSRLRCLARAIPGHPPDPAVTWVPGDLLSEADCREFVQGLDVVIHLAQANNPASSDRHWPGDHAANGLLGLNLLQALRERGGPPAHLVFASSGGSIYGAWPGRSFRESDPCAPLTPYGIQKLTFEHYLRLAVAQGWLTACSLRIANAYGSPLPAERRQGLIGVALQRVLEKTPFTIYGSADIVRDYVHLEDLGALMVSAVAPRAGFAIFNAGSGTGHSTGEIIDLVGRITGAPLTVEETSYGQAAFGLTPCVVLDPALTRETFGWQARISLEEGIDRLWQQMKNSASTSA